MEDWCILMYIEARINAPRLWHGLRLREKLSKLISILNDGKLTVALIRAARTNHIYSGLSVQLARKVESGKQKILVFMLV